MAFTYNNVSPTVINYKGTDIKVLKYGDTAVWGKPYSLTINTSTGVSATVNRSSSPNQHASTGILSNGSTVYYGDILGVTGAVSTGYTLDPNNTSVTGLGTGGVVNDNVVVNMSATLNTYTLSISAGTGSSITVNRTSSPNGGGATGNLSNGAVLYYGDNLTISYSASTGYNIGTHTVNGTSFTSGTQYTVSGDISVVTTASVKTYSLSISQGTGTTITVNRTASSYGGGSTGNLANNATLYYGDSLTISYSTGAAYNIGVHTVNSNTFTSGATYTVSSNISVVTTASVKTYQLSISAGSNTSVTVNRTASSYGGGSTGSLSNNATLYYGDNLTISYSVSSGYNISTHTVNGSTFTSGSQYTVSSNISVVTTAVVAQSWKTVWSGSVESSNIANTYNVGGATVEIPNYHYVSGRQTRITYQFYFMADQYGNAGYAWLSPPTVSTGNYMKQTSFPKPNNITISAFTASTATFNATNYPYAGVGPDSLTDGAYGTNANFKIKGYFYSSGYTDYMIKKIRVTKIEQYY